MDYDWFVLHSYGCRIVYLAVGIVFFVSKEVAPPHLQGLMQGCWLAATAVGNSLLFIGGILYTTVPIWACWLVFVGATGASMIVMLSMVKWLERVAK